MNEPRSVAVTGAGGFLGSHLAADQARRGRRVVASDLNLDRVRHLAKPGRFELIEGDISDASLQKLVLDGADVVFHLAAAHLSVGVPEAEFWRINVEAVRALVELAQQTGVGRFVHCSSVGVYGHVAHPPADEDSPCRPEIAYEKTKLAGERIVCEAIERVGLPAVVLRPAWVYGPGCGRTEKLFRSIAKGTFLMAGRGDCLRHCVYIRDMLETFELATTADSALGQVMIIGDARAVRVRELIDQIVSLTGGRRPVSLPLPLMYLAAAAIELAYRPFGKEPPVSRRSLKFFTGNWSFDISRARRLLGYEPRFDLRRGLTDTLQILGGEWRVPLPPPCD